jgi:beta-ribofuranosylaminobenzene 5'-phosphate synthase
MTRLRIRTPSRLHFGLLGWGPHAPRQFGGVGLMIDAPGIELAAEPAPRWSAEGPLAPRALQVAERVAARLVATGNPVSPARLTILRAPEEHVGLGVGTQLSLGVARAVIELTGLAAPSTAALADYSGRGLRSGIGLHGFALGGLIVDGGRRSPEGIPPLLARLEFPAEWSALVILPERTPGLHGPDEALAFAGLPPIPVAVTDRLCRLVLLGLLPAVLERDIASFGDALAEIQRLVGRGFAPAQGGTFAHAGLESLVSELKAEGLHGAGQSSWGPTLYAFTDLPPDDRDALLRRLRDRLSLDPTSIFWTVASRQGATLEPSP